MRWKPFDEMSGPWCLDSMAATVQLPSGATTVDVGDRFSMGRSQVTRLTFLDTYVGTWTIEIAGVQFSVDIGGGDSLTDIVAIWGAELIQVQGVGIRVVAPDKIDLAGIPGQAFAVTPIAPDDETKWTATELQAAVSPYYQGELEIEQLIEYWSRTDTGGVEQHWRLRCRRRLSGPVQDLKTTSDHVDLGEGDVGALTWKDGAKVSTFDSVPA